MEELKLSYKELYDEILKTDLNRVPEKAVLDTIEKIYQKVSRERNIPSSVAPTKPLWFTPVVQGVVVGLWTNDNPESTGLRFGAVKYMQEEAMRANDPIFIHDAIELIKSVLVDPATNV